MRHKKIILCAFFLLGFALTGLQAQEAALSSGGDASGSGGSASYSIGQVVYTTNIGSNGSSAQGVQQPYEISIVTGIDEVEGVTLQYSTFPNPTTDLITLKVETISLLNLNYSLYDINGQLFENRKIESNETSISMENLVPAIYFLKIFDNSKKEVKTFKIIKN